MYDNASIENYQTPSWERAVNQLSFEFIYESFEKREVRPELQSLAAAEMLMYLDMLIVSKLNQRFPVSMTTSVSKNNLKEIIEIIGQESVAHSDVTRTASIRQDFYRKSIYTDSRDEDFIRTVGMQWFQFPLEEIDGSIKPSEFDFSVYFSDNYVVTEILYDLAPRFADRIVNQLEKQYHGLMV